MCHIGIWSFQGVLLYTLHGHRCLKYIIIFHANSICLKKKENLRTIHRQITECNNLYNYDIKWWHRFQISAWVTQCFLKYHAHSSRAYLLNISLVQCITPTHIISYTERKVQHKNNNESPHTAEGTPSRNSPAMRWPLTSPHTSILHTIRVNLNITKLLRGKQEKDWHVDEHLRLFKCLSYVHTEELHLSLEFDPLPHIILCGKLTFCFENIVRPLPYCAGAEHVQNHWLSCW